MLTSSDASKPTRNGFVHPSGRGTQKPTEGTGLKTPTISGENLMAQVTYRGVKYDTNNKKAQQAKEVELTYRGIVHAK